MEDEPLSQRARALLDDDEDRHDEAIEVLRRAMVAREPSAVGLLARAYLDRGDRHRTIELLAPRVRAGQADLALQLADALASTGDVDRAEDAYRTAVRAGDVAAMNTFGVFLRHRGRLREAELLLRRAADAGDEMAVVNLVAVQWESHGDPRTALHTALDWADEAKPSTLLGLGFIRAALGQFDEAERTYRLAAKLGAYRGHIELALFLQEVREDTDGAEAELQTAEHEQEPGWALAYGQFLADVGRTSEARAYLEHAVHWGSLEAADIISELDGDLDDD
ncbi:tetratricopeptide repeat protein [Pseudonocardia spinosispora]|uniref:tetratricopeptide repeat protein n=1 Tax=Pseudonocardia spinosispora TaxID=103441 RepID=UPI00040E87FB|nr:tetratricopeptide repeat protein [Pseudonocardia spinosispora]